MLFENILAEINRTNWNQWCNVSIFASTGVERPPLTFPLAAESQTDIKIEPILREKEESVCITKSFSCREDINSEAGSSGVYSLMQVELREERSDFSSRDECFLEPYPRKEKIFTTEEEHYDIGSYGGKRVLVIRSTEILGQGSFSIVYGGTMCSEDYDCSVPISCTNFYIPVAIKEMVFPAEQKVRSMVHSMMDICCLVHHKHLVKNIYVGGKRDERSQSRPLLRVFCVMERGFGGSVYQRMKSKYRLSEIEAREIVKAVLLGLRHFHSIGIVHNDIKPQNIMICKELTFQDSGEEIFKIADLTSVAFASSVESIMSTLKTAPKKVLELSTSLLLPGTGLYMSPESCLGINGSTGADVWSLGITLFQLVTGFLPWCSAESSFSWMVIHGFRSKYARGNLIPFSVDTVGLNGFFELDDDEDASFGPIIEELKDRRSYSQELFDFVQLCLTEDFSFRPTCDALLTHPFITGTKK